MYGATTSWAPNTKPSRTFSGAPRSFRGQISQSKPDSGTNQPVNARFWNT